MSMRLDLSVTVSDSRKRAKTPYPSYNLETYLRSSPTSATERLVANETPITPADSEKKTIAELETWSSNFDKAAKSKRQC
ncbi:hypothetical protein F4776DRAFT_629823 [Hypoxylon sp. NC0597]|nr:hypothetical protein F4776DRAFT_629823 [Hypoxylon sp. NC0597]